MVDLFAIGVMSYEMIAGRRPWDGAAPQEVMVSVVKTPLPTITRAHPTLQRRLVPINRFLQRALSKKKEDRPVDAAAFFGELSEAIYGTARPLVVPSVHDASAELSAIHMRLPRTVRSDETQIDMQPAGRNLDAAAEKTIEFRASPHEASKDAAQTVVSNRSGRLASVWIQSMQSSPSLEEAIDTTLDDSLPVDMNKMEHPVTVTDTSRTRSLSPTRSIDTRTGRRSPWTWVAIAGGLVLMMCIAAAVGFLIGRG
jgi:serine/threonine protein kinase